MKKFLLLLIVLLSIILVSCDNSTENQATNNEIETPPQTNEKKSEFIVKIDGKDRKFEPLSSWARHSEQHISENKAAHTKIYLANFELDTSGGKFSLMQQELDKPGQIKIVFGILGEKGTASKTPIKVGKYEYKEKLDDRFGNIESLEIVYFTKSQIGMNIYDYGGLKGFVEILEVKNNTIKGKIDVTQGNNKIKGDFTIKGDKSVK